MTPRRHAALGLLFLAAVGILSYYTLFKTDFSLFEERQAVVAYAEDARGLRKGAPVLYAGVRWGKVEAVVPDLERPRDERVRIDISLDQPIVLFNDHEVIIESASVLGGVQLSIDPGSRPTGEVDASRPLRAGTAPDVLAAVGELVEENRESIRNTLDGLETAVGSLNATDGTIGRLLNDKETADNVTSAVASIEATFDNFQALTEELRGGQGTIGKLIYDEKLYNDIEEFVRGLDDAVADARQLMKDAREGEGVLAAVLYDDKIANDFRETAESIRSATEKIDRGDGTIAMLLNDNSLAEDVQSAIRTFSNPNGTVAKLFNERDIYDNVQQLSADLADAGAAIREQRGSLGILINDDGIATDLERALSVLTGGLEEQREAAPIATFLSTVFLGF
jgi:phospholipid/cholesterol/gamma-HCH transport system substrate-binding protein